jgi:hypothetical protein
MRSYEARFPLSWTAWCFRAAGSEAMNVRFPLLYENQIIDHKGLSQRHSENAINAKIAVRL